MIAYAVVDKKDPCRILWKEVHELVLIFSAINRKKNE